jgi:putative methylase
MGEPTQRRLIRKIDLERFLTEIKPNPAPKANLEQYTTPESVAATMLYLAAYTYNDIIGKRVLDLGCGTGRLALAAAYLGAAQVVGIDIDETAVKMAVQNAEAVEFGNCVNWVAGDIDTVVGTFDTVVMNPPFGVQKRSADRKFLQKALEVGCAVYSLHNHPEYDPQLMARLKAGGGQLLQIEPSPFMRRFVEELNGQVEAAYALSFAIPKMFDFHTKVKQQIAVDLYVTKKRC